jgi:hypothetical protein
MVGYCCRLFADGFELLWVGGSLLNRLTSFGLGLAVEVTGCRFHVLKPLSSKDLSGFAFPICGHSKNAVALNDYQVHLSI